MKSMLLHAPELRNDGSYADAGATVPIGDEPHAISAQRAATLIRRRRGKRVATR